MVLTMFRQGLLCLLLLLLLPACRKASPPHLVVLSPGGAAGKAVEQIVEEFRRENPGVEVQIVSTPGRDYYVKSLTMLAGKAHVDILWLGQGFGMFAGRQALLDLSPLIQDDPAFSFRHYHPAVVDWYRYRNALYSLPYGIDVQVIAYNKDLFDAAGVAYPTPDWTLDEMLEKAKALTRYQRGRGRTEVAGLGFLDLDYRYDGLSLLSEDHTRFGLNNEAGKAWMNRNLALIHRERILQRGSDMASMDRLSAFLNQQVAMIEFTPWDVQETYHRAPFRWDIVAVPTGREGKRKGWASSAGFGIARNCRQPRLAWALLKELTGPAFQRAMLKTTIPASSALHGEYLAANAAPPEHLSEFLRMLDFMDPNPRITAFTEVEAEWVYWKDLALLRKVSVEEALSGAESGINRILELHRKEEAQ